MTQNLYRRALPGVMAIGLACALASLACPDADQKASEALPIAAATGTEKEILEQLQSATLPYEPMPEWHVEPILRKFVESGWDIRAPLSADIKKLNIRSDAAKEIACHEVRFTSHEWRGKPIRIFGFYAHPVSYKGKLPALLIVHGGGGYATLDRVIDAAGQGYAALSIDLPGKGTLREQFSRSTGPDMTVKQIFTVKPSLEDNYIYHAVLAQIRSISFLCALSEVDASRIGLVGVSWGGATGLITTSLDKRVKCFVNMFGSGLLWEGSTWHSYFDTLPPREFAAWEDNFDASRYVSHISVPVLGLTGTNDNCYYLHRFTRTLRAIQPTPDLMLRPNLDHKIDEAARAGYYKWLAVHLKGLYGDGPPSLRGLKITADKKGATVQVRVGGRAAVSRVEVWYGEVGKVGWTNRKWKPIACKPDYAKSWWTANAPLPTQITYLFATAFFSDGSSLSTPVHSVARAAINDSVFALDLPFIHDGAFLVEAHAFAQMTGSKVVGIAGGQAPRITLRRGHVQAECEAKAHMGGLYYVSLREVCEKLKGIVAFHDDMPVISLTSLRS